MWSFKRNRKANHEMHETKKAKSHETERLFLRVVSKRFRVFRGSFAVLGNISGKGKL
jgi:hypothetical protein